MSEETPFKYDRPRRSTRAPAKVPTTAIATSSKRKSGNEGDAATAAHKKPKIDQLEFLLTDPKSTLTTMDISDILNFNTWDMLSHDARTRLARLLPLTAFYGYQPILSPTHPSQLDKPAFDTMDVDDNGFRCADTLDTGIFVDSHFLAAAHTFQDHIFTGWMTDAHAKKLAQFDQGVRDGTIHAPWKDEVWENGSSTEAGSQAESSARAGEAAELRLSDLIKSSLVKVGDILSYTRHFSHLNLTVEKDALIQSIDHRTSVLTVLVQPGTSPLPQNLLDRNPPDSLPPTQIMAIASPSQLENGILDLEGRVDKSKRPNGNAWKQISVWRWPEGGWQDGFAPLKGGRESHGTLFYLRGNLYYER